MEYNTLDWIVGLQALFCRKDSYSPIGLHHVIIMYGCSYKLAVHICVLLRFKFFQNFRVPD